MSKAGELLLQRRLRPLSVSWATQTQPAVSSIMLFCLQSWSPLINALETVVFFCLSLLSHVTHLCIKQDTNLIHTVYAFLCHCNPDQRSKQTFYFKMLIINYNLYNPMLYNGHQSQFPVTSNWELQPFAPLFNYFNNVSDNFIFDIIFSKPLLANCFCCLSALIYKTIETITFSFSKHFIFSPMHSTFYS